jgi:hypothetical protein
MKQDIEGQIPDTIKVKYSLMLINDHEIILHHTLA